MDTITEIIPNLYVGGYGGAMDEDLLKTHNIRTIITLSSKLELPHKDEYEYYLYDIQDACDFNIDYYFEDIVSIIYQSIQKNNNTLIHCYCGASRSVTFCIAYLIKYHNMTLVQAYELIRSKRNIIEPNNGFIGKLIIYYNQSEENFENYNEYLRIINIINSIGTTNLNAVDIYRKKLSSLAKKLGIIYDV